MEKRNVVIYVAGQRFSITTSDSEEYVIGIGEKVDVMIKGIAKDNPRLNRDACAILAALDLCDDETKLRQMMEVLRSQVKDYLEANEKLREENETLRAQLAQLKEAGATASEVSEVSEETETTPETEAETATESACPVLSRSEALVMAEASESETRHTAFVGKDFRSGKKQKKNKKHGKHQPVQTSAPAASTAAPADTTDDDQSPYHQFSIFDDIVE